MMDLGVVMVFAVLQISLQTAGTDSSQAIPAEDSSMTERADKQQSATEFQSFLEWTEMNLPKDVPKDAVTVFDKKSKQTFHVAKFQDCKPCFYDSAKKTCWDITSHEEFKLGSAVPNAKVSFLVNKDNFELLQWKKSSYGEIPPLAVETCNGYFIARDDLGLGYMTENSLMVLGTTENEVLTLNHDIKGHLLTITEYNIAAQVTSENTEVLKHFTAYNRNCEPAKHQVKLDQGIDKTVSFLKTHTHTVGGTGDTTFKGKVPFLASIGGKLGLKYDFSRLSSKTTSTVEKSLHSVSMEVQVPANQMCSIDIKSNTFTAEVPYTGQLTRIYNNNEIRRTLINDVYSHHEVAEIQALVNPCTLLSDGEKC